MAFTDASGSLAATGSSSGYERFGEFSLTLDGTFAGTVALEARPVAPSGATWAPVATDGAGTASAFTAPTRVIVTEVEQGIEYRVTFTRTSGTVNWRMSGAAPRRAFA